MVRRKTPRLHIRFESFYQLDKIEAWANNQGEKLVGWARKAIQRQAQAESAHEIILEAAMFSSFEAVSLLRELAGPEASERASKNAADYIKMVKDDVSKNFD